MPFGTRRKVALLDIPFVQVPIYSFIDPIIKDEGNMKRWKIDSTFEKGYTLMDTLKQLHFELFKREPKTYMESFKFSDAILSMKFEGKEF